MKNRWLALCLCALLLLSACAGEAEKGKHFTVACTTYPVYLLAREVAEGAADVALEVVVNQPMSCLHDYTLSVADMKTLQGADLLLLSGAGLEEFLASALESAAVPTVDCSEGVELLSIGGEGPHGHDGDHEEAYDPHIWMDPERAAVMAENIAAALAEIDPNQAELYRANGERYAQTLRELAASLREELSVLSCRELITFHEGFGYLAEAMDLTILKAIEEEAGSEASAKEIVEVVELVREHRLPAIFTEENGSDATAGVVARETGAEVRELTMLMSADGFPAGEELSYEAGMRRNVKEIMEALKG